MFEDLDKLGITPSTTPLPSSSAGGSLSPSPAIPDWNVAVQTPVCGANKTADIVIATTATQQGYISIEFLSSTNTFVSSRTDEITPPSELQNYTLPAGFSNTSWRVLLYEGGTKNSAGSYTAGTGTLKFTLPTQTKTNCT